MSPMHDQDERTLGSLLDEWAADEPPAGFAPTVVRAARPAEGMTVSRWTPRGVVVPLLLAALFVSLGAAAFSEHAERRERKKAALLAETRQEPKKPTQLVFHVSQEVSQAEPDPVRAFRAAKPRDLPLTSSTLSPPTEASQAEVPAEERPRVVHFPHCECGTSGVVCSCSD